MEAMKVTGTLKANHIENVIKVDETDVRVCTGGGFPISSRWFFSKTTDPHNLTSKLFTDKRAEFCDRELGLSPTWGES